MGLFSSKTRIDVDVVTQSLIEEKQNFIKQGIIAGTLSGGGAAFGLKQELTNSLSSHVDKFYRIAKREPAITLPEGYSLKDTADISEVRKAIEADLNISVLVRDAFISGVIADSFGLYYVQETYGINHQNNEITNRINNEGTKQVYLNAEYLNPTLLKINYEVFKTTGNEVKSIEVTYPVNQNGVFYFAYYIKNKTELLFWFKEIGNVNSNGEETMNEIEYLPILEIKQNNKTILEAGNEDKLEAYEKACKPLGFSFKDMAESILESTADNDPSQMRDIFFQFAADIHTEDKYTNMYLYEYFDLLRSEQKTEKAEYLKWITETNKRAFNFDSPTNLIRVVEGNYDANLLFNYIELTFETDTDDLKEGDIKKEFTVRPPIELSRRFGVFRFNVENIEQSEMVLKKKINATQVAVLTIHGLTHIHTVLTTNVVRRTIANSLDLANTEDDDKSFFIPISMKAIRKLSPIKRSFIYQDTMSVTVYSEVRTKVKWYQRGAFKIVLAIVLIVIAITTGYVDFTSWAALFASLATIAATQLIIQLIILPILVKVIEIIGIEAGAIIAVLLAVAAIATGNFTSAMNLLEMASWTFQAVTTVAGNIIQEFQEELAKLFNAFKDFQKEIDEINDALGGGQNDYLLNAIKGFYFDPNETPDMFFYRTIHDTNPGIKVYDFVDNFVSMRLELPKVKHNFKDTYNVGGE